METRASILMLGVVFALIANELPAETNASCCRCASFYKLSDEGFGYLRHHVGFCPKCTEEMGGSVDAYLDKLRGRNRGLADAARLTLEQIKKSTAARDKARDSIYGRNGSATGFFKSLLSFSAEGANGAFKTVAKNVKKGLGWYNKAADTVQGDFKWVEKEGKAWVEGKTVGAAKDKALLKSAAAMGGSYYKQTGDARGATKQFLNAHGDLKKGVSVLEAAIDFYEKTDKLANGIQAYLEHRADAERQWKEWNSLVDDMEKLLAEIAKMEHCRQLMQQGSQGAARRRSGWTYAHASETTLADERAAVKELVFPTDGPNAAALRSALSTLTQLRSNLAEFQNNLEQELLPPLLPFWYDVQTELGWDFSKALMEWADQPSESAARQFDRLVRFGEGVADDIRRADKLGKTL